MEDIPFGKLVYSRRKELKMTAEKLGKYCGIDKTYISKIERHNFIPTTKILVGLSYALNQPTSFYIGKAFREKLKELKGLATIQLDKPSKELLDVLEMRGILSENVARFSRHKPLHQWLKLLEQVDTDIHKFSTRFHRLFNDTTGKIIREIAAIQKEDEKKRREELRIMKEEIKKSKS